jgi:thioredoxin family protein
MVVVARILCVLLAVWMQSAAPSASPSAPALFDRAATWQQFLDHVNVQRDRWLENAQADVSPADVARLTRVRKGLRLLIVAEDWCADSVNTIPYIATLAASGGVELRIIDRAAGAPLMQQHRARDGRTVTPVVIFLRDDRDVDAWLERPAVLQDLFRSMAGDAERSRRFAERQAWYDADRGRTTLDEILAIAERTAANR